MDAVTSVAVHLEAEVTESAELSFAVALDGSCAASCETLTCTVAGRPLALTEVVIAGGGRHHVAKVVPPGQLVLDYTATGRRPAAPASVTASDELAYRRPSRYCESDRLAVSSGRLFDGLTGRALADGVADWVNGATRYVPGSSGPLDGAADTFLSGQGVCRDFAHLVAALLRARGVPARVASVYAPGLWPMDFHAVTEVAIDGVWQVIDATRLAPRASMLRIATGLDAADTAFLNVHTGGVTFGVVEVTCVALPGLPVEDSRTLVYL